MQSASIRISRAPEGTTPFVVSDDGVAFDGQGGRRIEFGHCFDDERGYRAYFCFADTPIFKNTWAGESLLQWADQVEPVDVASRSLRRDCCRLAKQVIALNAEWERQGRPAGGIVEGEAGHG